ncbi:MAG: hypothetical protein KKB51_10365 [Candidatus Riflebacteria bacterium]|nr:hypothetical protein [Candidatus Riflebacteria bacterium]
MVTPFLLFRFKQRQDVRAFSVGGFESAATDALLGNTAISSDIVVEAVISTTMAVSSLLLLPRHLVLLF